MARFADVLFGKLQLVDGFNYTDLTSEEFSDHRERTIKKAPCEDACNFRRIVNTQFSIKPERTVFVERTEVDHEAIRVAFVRGLV